MKFEEIIVGSWVRIKTFEEFGSKLPLHFVPQMSSYYGKFVEVSEVNWDKDFFRGVIREDDLTGNAIFKASDIAEEWKEHLAMYRVIRKIKEEIGI